VQAKVIIPKGLVFNAPALARAIENALEGAAKDVKVDFQVTTQTWNTRPEFTVERKTAERIVSTQDEVYGYVDEGTPKHEISPKPGGMLVFGTGGSPKTRPLAIGSTRGRQGGVIVHTRKPVHHPGTKARQFSDVIKEKWDKQLPVIMQRSR
jgi:hypothetical protein